MMVRRKTIEEAGLLDEDFFMYGEDLDWCFRIKKAGWKTYALPQCKVIHSRSRSIDQWSKKDRYDVEEYCSSLFSSVISF